MPDQAPALTPPLDLLRRALPKLSPRLQAAGPGFYPGLTGALTRALAAAFVLGGPAALTRLRGAETWLASHQQLLPIAEHAP